MSNKFYGDIRISSSDQKVSISPGVSLLQNLALSFRYWIYCYVHQGGGELGLVSVTIQNIQTVYAGELQAKEVQIVRK